VIDVHVLPRDVDDVLARHGRKSRRVILVVTVRQPLRPEPDDRVVDALNRRERRRQSGVAALLTIAKAFMALPKAPARSILFVATTGDELGEIGSDYLVHHSPVPIDRIVASLNVDGISFKKFDPAVVGGGSNSSLGRTAANAARRLGIGVKNESIGVGGSDHSPFLLAGIPVLWIFAELTDEWMRTRYHSASG